jgi:hypothetical protein
LACLVVLGAALTGCAGKGDVPDAQPMPEDASFEGVWYSPQFEHMYLRQEGDTVRGVYAYKTGGTLKGTVNGNLLVFDWNDPGSKEQATRSMSGRGYFQLKRNDDGVLILRGEWGYGEDRAGAGPWNAEWVREIDSEDPSNLREMRDTQYDER